MLIHSVTALTPNGELANAYVGVKDGRIAAIGQGEPPPSVCAMLGNSPAIHDAHGLALCPGFIDLHVHGGGGSDTMNGDVSALLNVARTHAGGGTTRLLATTMSAPTLDTHRALGAVADACALCDSGQWSGSHIMGSHMEGPFLSQGFRGAHPAEAVRPLDLPELEGYLSSARGTVRMVTFAPELPGACAAASHLRGVGVVPVIGHSGASYEETMCAVCAGMTNVTHVMNGMRALHHRNPGVLGAVLSSPAVSVQIIADGLHIHPAVVKLLIACKGISNSILITDGIEAVGLPDGQYRLGPSEVTVKGGLCTLPNGTIAGSTLTMNKAVRNAAEFGACTRLEAVTMASLAPATVLGIADRTGSIEVGKLADIVLIDDEFRVRATYVAGRLIYEAPTISA